MSSQVANYVFCGHSRVGVCQERNFGNVHYLRDLRCHALGAQMRQAVSSGISLNATRPAQPISLLKRSEAALTLKVECHILDTCRFCVTLWCNMNKYSDCGGSE